MKAALAILSTLAVAARLAIAAKPYTSKNCLVSGKELGSMGKVVTKVYDDQEVKFCCKSCVKKFEADPAKYLSKLN